MSSLLEEAYAPPLPTTQGGSERGQAPPPIPSYHLKKVAGGVPTELLVQTFDDRIFVVITQTGKLGSLVQAQIPPVTPLPPPRRPSPAAEDTEAPLVKRPTLPPAPDALHQTPLLGTPPNPTLHALYTSQIATLIWWALQEVGAPRRPVVIALALAKTSQSQSTQDDEEEITEEERDRFYEIMDMVVSWPGPS